MAVTKFYSPSSKCWLRYKTTWSKMFGLLWNSWFWLVAYPNSLTSSVLSESLAEDTSIIVAYHPTIFNGLKSFTLSNPLQTSLLHCAAEGISVYSPHTALDSVWGGINDWLAEGLMKAKGDGEIRALVAEKLNASSGESEGGEGRIVTLKEPIAMDVLEKRIKSHLKLSQSLFFSLSFFSFLKAAGSDHWIAYVDSPSRISLCRQISIYAYPYSRHLRRVGRVHATWPRGWCISHRGDVARTDIFLPVRDDAKIKLMFVTQTARGFGCSRDWKKRHSLWVPTHNIFMSLLLVDHNSIDFKVDIRILNGAIFLYSLRNYTTSFKPMNSRIKVWEMWRC